MADTPAYLESLTRLHPLSELLWLYDQQGIFFVIKVPSRVNSKDLSIIFEKSRIIEDEDISGHRETIVEILYSTRMNYREPSVSQSCLFRIQSGLNQKLTRQLSRNFLVRVILYNDGQIPRKLGVKLIQWHAIPHNVLKKLVAKKNPSISNNEAQIQDIDSIPPMTLSEVRKRFSTFFNLRGLIAKQVGQPMNLRIFMVIPHETSFETISVAFEALNWWNVPAGRILSLRCILQDSEQRQLGIECIIDPLRERNVLQLMSTTENVEVVALGNSVGYPNLGWKQFSWPQSKRLRAQDLLAVSRMVAPPTSWRKSLITFLQRTHPATTFQIPDTFQIPHTPDGALETMKLQRNFRRIEDIQSDQHLYRADAFTNAHLSIEHQKDKEIRMEEEIQPQAPILSGPLTPPTPRGSLIERSILLHQAGAQQEFARLGTFSRGIFWRMLFAFALEQTPRKYIWTPEAVALIEDHRQQLTPDSRTPWLPSHEHVWIEFPEPIATPVGHDIAALTVFAPGDTRLLQRLQQHMGMSAKVLTRLEHTLYNPEKHRLIFNIIDSRGRIVWAIGLNTARDTQLDGKPKVWGTAPWFFCPNPQCLLHTKAAPALCESCTVMRTFIWTWLLAARQSLLGLYREQFGETDQMFEEHKHKKLERTNRILFSFPENEREELLKTQHQYRVVRSIDIAVTTDRERKPSQTQRGSWVEALATIDPALFFYDEREIALTTRTLKDPRYARYIAEHGTNQIEVRSHTRHIPMRADSKRMTRVTARKKLNDSE